MTKRKKYETQVKLGEFPFPIIDGPKESRYLTWIRNHSNYMAVRGVLDYLRAISVLLRGIVINALVLLPFLLIFSTVVAYWYLNARSFSLTFLVLILAVVFVLLFPLLTPYFKILTNRKRLRTGSDSSVWLRDKFERLFGGILLAVLVLASFESLSFLLTHFHAFVYEKERYPWPEFASLLTGATVVLAAADKLLTALGGLMRKLAILAIGAFGLIVPLLFVLLVADYLVFRPASLDWTTVNYFFWYGFIIVTAIAVLLGMISWLIRSFNTTDLFKTIVLFIAGLFFVIPIIGADEWAWGKKQSFDGKLEEAIEIVFPDTTMVYEEIVVFGEPPAYESQNERQAKVRAVQDKLFEFFDGLFSLEADDTSPSDDRFADDRKEFLENVAKEPGPRWRDLIEILDQEFEYLLDEAEDFGSLKSDYSLSTSDREKLDDFVLSIGNNLRVLLPSRFIARYADEYFSPEDIDSEVEITKIRTEFVSRIESSNYDKSVSLNLELVEVSEGDASDLKRQLLWLSQDLDRFHLVIEKAREELAVSAFYSQSLYPDFYFSAVGEDLRKNSYMANATYVGTFALMLWFVTRLTVDINLTSIHALYRDRLATAYLVGVDTKGDVDIEKDLDLAEICRHEAGSIAPYHLINAAINLQGTKDIGIRDRQSDFFIFSKKFIGGHRTRYCRSDTMERFFPQMGLATAMAISAAAASPNMGRSTNRALVAIMTLLNIRLGYWMPNPNRLETWLSKRKVEGGKDKGYSFTDVFTEELDEVENRWEQLDDRSGRYLSAVEEDRTRPTIRHRLFGIGFSGGGIRSATLNLGIAQALHKRGVFDHIDYMSTVSGGGYLGSSISALMRHRKSSSVSEIFGRASVTVDSEGKKIVTISQQGLPNIKPKENGRLSRLASRWPLHGETRRYEFSSYADIAVKDRQWVRPGHRLLSAGVAPSKKQNSFSDLFKWRVRTSALRREVLSQLDEEHRWVNVSDGGHIENLACIELLRRRCKYIIIGDGEADRDHHFEGLATLIRTARIDLGVHIDINVDALRLNKKGLSKRHWAIGQINYPARDDKETKDDKESGHLLYLKSSLTGEEDEVINNYRNVKNNFPHESTADQSFTEGQFEAYRSLGQHIVEQLFEESDAPGSSDEKMSFTDFEDWFESLWHKEERARERKDS